MSLLQPSTFLFKVLQMLIACPSSFQKDIILQLGKLRNSLCYLTQLAQLVSDG